jgi:hypothetical protein
MMKKFLILFMMIAPSFLMASNDYDYPKDDYEQPEAPTSYSCDLTADVSFKQNFRTRQEADALCATLGKDYCRTIRSDRNGWDSVFYRSLKLKFVSDESFSLARKILFFKLQETIETSSYYKPGFTVTFWFSNCGK